jgi:hypothetical protein
MRTGRMRMGVRMRVSTGVGAGVKVGVRMGGGVRWDSGRLGAGGVLGAVVKVVIMVVVIMVVVIMVVVIMVALVVAVVTVVILAVILAVVIVTVVVVVGAALSGVYSERTVVVVTVHNSMAALQGQRSWCRCTQAHPGHSARGKGRGVGVGTSSAQCTVHTRARGLVERLDGGRRTASWMDAVLAVCSADPKASRLQTGASYHLSPRGA